MVASLGWLADRYFHGWRPPYYRLVSGIGAATSGRIEELELVEIAPSNEDELDALRLANADWLQPWDVASPHPQQPFTPAQFRRALRDAVARGQMVSFLIVVGGRAVGQVTIQDIIRGGAWTASLGYWVGRAHAGLGIMPVAVAAACDFAFTELGLNRVEVCIRPDNVASLAVVGKLGLRCEGLRHSYMHTRAGWVDHICYAITAAEAAAAPLPGGTAVGGRPGGGGGPRGRMAAGPSTSRLVAALIAGGGRIAKFPAPQVSPPPAQQAVRDLGKTPPLWQV